MPAWQQLGGHGLVPSWRIDPNLYWALATSLRAMHRQAGPLPQTVPLVVELAAGRDAVQLQRYIGGRGGMVRPVYLQGSQRYCTADVPLRLARDIARNANGRFDLVSRLDLALPVIPQRPRPLRRRPTPAARPAPFPQSRGSVLLGVIDDGCAFAHQCLRKSDGSQTRVLALWDQDEESSFGGGGGAPPAAFEYGRQMRRDQLNALMRAARDPISGAIDEDACYRIAGYERLFSAAAHGTFVLDLFAGHVGLTSRLTGNPAAPQSWAKTPDKASQADIVFVQMPRDAVQDTSSAALAGNLLDGLHYIVGCATDATRRIVVNISDGSSRGSHDGESLIELAMADLVLGQRSAHRNRELRIVLPSGNSYDDARHAELGVPARGSGRLTLRLPPDCQAPTFVQWSLPGNASGLALRVVAPSGVAGPWVSEGDAQAWMEAGQAVVSVVNSGPGPTGKERRLAMIAFAPTASDDPKCAIAPAGDWKLELQSKRRVAGDIHAYISRNDVNLNTLSRGRQARFIDNDYDPERHLRELEVEPERPRSPIRRKGTLNSLACGTVDGIVVVCGARLREYEVSAYSSDGPAAGSSPNRRQEPDICQVSDESRSAPGLRAAGTRSGLTVRLQGTSFAAPQMARAEANRD